VDALLALHFQNDVVHPEGKIRAGVGDDSQRAALLRNAHRLLAGARRHGVHVVSVRIAFRRGHAGVIQNSPQLRAAVRERAVRMQRDQVKGHTQQDRAAQVLAAQLLAVRGRSASG